MKITHPRVLAPLAAVALMASALIWPADAAEPARSAAVTITRDIAYGSDPAQKLDVHTPTATGTLPAVVVIHGGAWQNGDKTEFTDLATYIAGNAPAVVFNINYRLGTAGKYPRAVDDARLATLWVKANATTYGIDPARVGVLGSSAGAHLAGMILPDVRAMVGWSGTYDLPALAAPNPDGTNSISKFLGCKYTACPATWADASPVNHPAGAALQLVSSAGENIPPSQAQDLATAERGAGGTAEVYLLAGTKHAAAFSTSRLPDGRTVRDAAVAFLRTELAPGPEPTETPTPTPSDTETVAPTVTPTPTSTTC